MLSKSDTDITQALARFTRHELEVSFLVPTPTGLEKSILDAIEPLRQYLQRSGIHDFEAQAQAEKVVRRAYFVFPDKQEETKVSLYRPQTKQGDPRIWFYRLNTYARQFNLLAILAHEGDLYVINASDSRVLESIETPSTPLGRLAALKGKLDAAANQLLELLSAIGRKGFVRSLRSGDTGIGFTLESMLGIAANTNRLPDFHGIELKASRSFGGGSGRNRVTLFSQVPNWKESPLSSGNAILARFGYERGGRRQLYCTVGAEPNPQGLFFEAEPTTLWNRAKHKQGVEDVACWAAEDLQARLLQKHPATMWIKAKCRGSRTSSEEFHYVEAVYTRNPMAANLLPLLEAGTVTMDYTLSTKENGGARDHGYLFKIHPRDLPALFPPPRRFTLAE